MAKDAESGVAFEGAPVTKHGDTPITDKAIAAAESAQSSFTISLKKLPYGGTEIFEDSSFFRRSDQRSKLPSPEEVRQKFYESSQFQRIPSRPPPVRFPDLDLLVKFGREITIAEGQCLWTLQNTLKDKVLTPEIYGWCQNDGETFIYMQLVRGDTLEQRWPDLSDAEKSAVCEQLKPMIEALRCLKLNENEQFIGHIAGQPLLDIIFVDAGCAPAGPFPDVTTFHDWFTNLKQPQSEAMSPHPYRNMLPDNFEIKFTHADLHRSNILLSPIEDGPAKVISIIDWHQSGWYPSYWEFCKALWTAEIVEGWDTEFLPRFLEKCEEYDIWDYFVLRLGV